MKTKIIENVDGSLNIPLHEELILVTYMTKSFFRVQKVYLYYENSFIDDLNLSIHEQKLVVEAIDYEMMMKHKKVLQLMKDNDILFGDIDKPQKWRILHFDWYKGWTLDNINYFY